MNAAERPILSLDALAVRFPGAPPAVRSISLQIAAGECLGIVGESGSGKSLAFLAALGLAPPGAQVTGGAWFRDINLIDASPAVLRALRGRRVAMVFQNPMSSLTPHLTIGVQLVETLRAHSGLAQRAARERAAGLLTQVRLTDPRARLDQFPWQLSGGMRQRVMIAMALAGEPELLIADEPTTALDVTTQAGILRLLLELKQTRGLALALISHDFGVIAGLADRVAVIRAGCVLETGAVHDVFAAPREEYTRTLLAAARSLEGGRQTDGRAAASRERAAPSAARDSLTTGDSLAARDPLAVADALSVRDLSVRFARARRALKPPRPVLDHVSLRIPVGSTFGVLGESGSGKSTLMRAILRLIPAESGAVVWMGADIGALDRRALQDFRAHAQLVFQDPLGSLDPSMRIEDLIAEPLSIHRRMQAAERRERVLRSMDDVRLDRTLLRRFPAELSGGQCQRVGIARALVLDPALLVCDEPISALDAAVQIQIIALLREVAARGGRTTILVSHHLGIVRALCANSAVLYHGRVMETGPTEKLCTAPRHPYTRMLLDAIPVVEPVVQRARLLTRAPDEDGGDVRAENAAAIVGCVFRARCPFSIPRCAEESPVLEPADGSDGTARGPGNCAAHEAACLRLSELNTVRLPEGQAILDP